MERRVAIKKLVGSKVAQVEEYPLESFKELTIGRDTSCEVKYDPDQEDLVSRRHAKIVVEDADKCSFLISDLGSRNGTFVNKQRIFGPVRLMPGDHVQLGAGGPEFQFDVDPRPEGMARPTRLAADAGLVPVPGPTREAAAAAAAPVVEATSARTGVGRATVERMITETKKETRRNLYISAGALLVIIVIVAGVLALRKPTTPPPILVDSGSGALTPNQIAQASTDAVVYMEAGWKLVSTSSGRQLNQAYIPNRTKNKEGKEVRMVPVDQEYLPVFVAMGGTDIEPLLTTDDGKGKNKAIGGQHAGSGFVVSSDGFILTNRHVASNWYTTYSWPPDQAGLLLVVDENFRVKQQIPIGRERFPQWVPANAKFVFEGELNTDSLRVITQLSRVMAKQVEGRNDYLDVTFAKNRIRIPAKIARVSDRADVAMVKVELPQSLHKVDLNDNYDTIKVGDAAIVMGYPGVSPPVLGTTGSSDPLNKESVLTVIPDPTLSAGNIGRVIRGQAGLTEATFSTIGDVYQLTVNSTGHGNSGGPVFDDHGRVTGIFTYSNVQIGDAAVTFAVPIRYGMELMGVSKPK